MTTEITEIAPDMFRLSIYESAFNLQFNHFLIRDDEPLLFHTGFRHTFPQLQEAVAKLIDVPKLRWISFSHYESDECGSLNEWLAAAPQAEPACSLVGALVSVNDASNRSARGLADGDILTTGKYRFRFCQTPHLPHGWDAGLLFEETQGTLLSSDLFHHDGKVEALTETDIVERSKRALLSLQSSPLANYVPYTRQTGEILHGLAKLNPRTIAVMHGSSFRGDGAQALRDLAAMLQEVLDGK